MERIFLTRVELKTVQGIARFIKSIILSVFRKSVLLAGGVPMKQIKEWLGHSDMSTTANIYSHLDAVTKADTGGAAMSKALG